MMDTPLCPYCDAEAILSTINDFYGRQIKDGYMYVCANYPKCDSYVGCHPGTKKRLGRMADAELRGYRKALHAIFDPQWKNATTQKSKVRSELYQWLADKLGIPVQRCHMSYLNIEEAKNALYVCHHQFTNYWH